jgi:DNA-binding NarL/FixJ family response regulator
MRKNDGILRILLAGPDVLFREGLRDILDSEEDFRVVGEAADLMAVPEAAQRCNPDLFLMDLEWTDSTGRVLQRLSDQSHGVTIIQLTDELHPVRALEALHRGAHAVFPKDSSVKSLIRCIRAVADGGYCVGADVFPTLGLALESVGHIGVQKSMPGFGLTGRELEIIASVVAGRTNREISQIHRISEDTVKHHLSNIFDKVGVYNRLELALFTLHHGLVSKTMLMARGEPRQAVSEQETPAAG